MKENNIKVNNKKSVEWNSKGYQVCFRLEENQLIFCGKHYPLSIITNRKLLNMYNMGKINLPLEHFTDERVLYYCVRKIMERENQRNEKLFIDILLYEKALGAISNNTFNRSLGHQNDINEIEIHQVLKGKILEIIELNGITYVGIFSAGEYFEIPPNAFHCTYVLEDDTIVANIFGNVSWADDYEKKPYFEYSNCVNIGYQDSCYIYEKGTETTCILDLELSTIEDVNCRRYSQLDKTTLVITKKFDIQGINIFELFEKMINS